MKFYTFKTFTVHKSTYSKFCFAFNACFFHCIIICKCLFSYFNKALRKHNIFNSTTNKGFIIYFLYSFWQNDIS